ncbi:unnamed protein product [Plutella xylostella]|uniref:(diamondback moth) hypothetical protein n=1 Tax=Plutella xylostella TaxID=51655 RepID=A0A8S4GFD0_PLUXY|nr:unnamed protein product [Plutella xylostella]
MNELQSCILLKDTYVCQLQKPVRRLQNDKDLCLSSDKNTDQCIIEKNICKNQWVELNTPSQYFMFNKVALINGVTFDAFIDFGSECTMMKFSEFRKIYSEFDTTNLPLLKGFGNSVVQAIGKRQVQVLIDSVAADVELIVVPDNAMHVPLLVGQTFTEQPHIVITKTSD